MANGDFLFFGKSSVFARAPPLAIRIIAPLSLSICSCQRSALCAIVLLCLLQVSCDAVRMSNVVRRSPETAKLFSQQRMRMSAMACKWIIVSATSPFFLFFIPCARRSLLHSPIGSGVCVWCERWRTFTVKYCEWFCLPLHPACCTVLFPGTVIPPPVRLSERQATKLANKRHCGGSGTSEKQMEDRKSHNGSCTTVLPYCRTKGQTTKPPRDNDNNKKPTNKLTKINFFMFYRLCGHYTKLLSLGTVFVGCWILDDIVKAHRRCRCFAWHCCARNSTAISLGNVFAAPQYMRYVSWWIMAYAPHTMPPP